MKKSEGRKHSFIILFVVPVLIVFIACAKNPKPTEISETNVLPLATGTFWQIGVSRLQSWTDEQLANEVALVKEMGMDVIIIHYSAQWNLQKGVYHTFIPNNVFPLYSGLGRRNPLDAIFKAAERLGMKIIIGDFLVPTNLRYDNPKEAFEYWLSDEAMSFRRTIVDRYKGSSSFYGYYIANEPNPNNITSDEFEKLWIQSTAQVVRFIKSLKSELKVIHSIGLYPEWIASEPSAPSRAFLDRFWRPWIKEIDEIDIWMVIDGIGTSLSTHTHTKMAQRWGRELTSEYHKEFWVDVENAKMTNEFIPFHITQLKKSLEVATESADKIVLFEHLSYMTPNNGKSAAERLYNDYIEYRKRVVQH